MLLRCLARHGSQLLAVASSSCRKESTQRNRGLGWQSCLSEPFKESTEPLASVLLFVVCTWVSTTRVFFCFLIAGACLFSASDDRGEMQ